MDLAGNSSEDDQTTDTSIVTFDKTSPVVQISIGSNNFYRRPRDSRGLGYV